MRRRKLRATAEQGEASPKKSVCFQKSLAPGSGEEGHKVGGRRGRQIVGQREKLLALGQLSAGLTHQLNNPAAATARAVADLHDRIGKMRHKLAMLADGKFTPEALGVLVRMQDEVADLPTEPSGQTSEPAEEPRAGPINIVRFEWRIISATIRK